MVDDQRVGPAGFGEATFGVVTLGDRASAGVGDEVVVNVVDR